MTEKIAASLLESYPPEIALRYEEHGPEITRLGAAVAEYLSANQLDPSEVLFAGFDNDAPNLKVQNIGKLAMNHSFILETRLA